jgi:DNA-binding transcriptional ArsR family regulator
MSDDERILDRLMVPDAVLESIRSQGGVEALLQSIPGDRELQREAMLHKALSDPARLRIMHALLHSDLCPCVLKEVHPMADSRLSYHLSKLEEAELVEFDRDKNWRVYRLTERGRQVMATL